MQKLKIGYAATPQIAADLLELILADESIPVEVTFVVTQPDRPVGRKQVLTASPVKQVAHKSNIEIFTHLSNAQNHLHQIDLMLVFAYGELIPQSMIEAVKLGFWNIHPSLLPQYRGPSPIAYPLILGDKTTGVSLMQIDEQLDHGPIIAQESLEISPIDTRKDLEKKIVELSFQMLKKSFVQVVKNTEQKHELATFTRHLDKQDGFIPLSMLKTVLESKPLIDSEIPSIIKEYFEKNPIQKFSQWLEQFSSPQIIFNLYRGLYSWPGIWTKVIINNQEKRLKITRMSLIDNKLMIENVQLEGKNEVDFQTFNSAYEVFKPKQLLEL